jgi:hypothetical protein
MGLIGPAPASIHQEAIQALRVYSPQESDRSRNSGRRFSCKKRKDCWNDGWSAGGRTGILYGSDCFRRVTPPPPCLFRFWYGNLDRYFYFFRRETRPAFQLVCTWCTVNYSLMFDSIQMKKQKYNNNNKIK